MLIFPLSLFVVALSIRFTEVNAVELEDYVQEIFQVQLAEMSRDTRLAVVTYQIRYFMFHKKDSKDDAPVIGDSLQPLLALGLWTYCVDDSVIRDELTYLNGSTNAEARSEQPVDGLGYGEEILQLKKEDILKFGKVVLQSFAAKYGGNIDTKKLKFACVKPRAFHGMTARNMTKTYVMFTIFLTQNE